MLSFRVNHVLYAEAGHFFPFNIPREEGQEENPLLILLLLLFHLHLRILLLLLLLTCDRRPTGHVIPIVVVVVVVVAAAAVAVELPQSQCLVKKIVSKIPIFWIFLFYMPIYICVWLECPRACSRRGGSLFILKSKCEKRRLYRRA